MKGDDRAIVEKLMSEMIKQAVEDWETCVKRHWKGKRETRICCGGMPQTRFDIADWLKDFTPQAHAIFPMSAKRMAEEMASEYKSKYKAMRKAEDAYAHCELYPYWNTKGLQAQRQEIIDQVEAELIQERHNKEQMARRHGEQI